jgi:hypothetical protein
MATISLAAILRNARFGGLLKVWPEKWMQIIQGLG